jgi:TetR/AcrR family transcriptional regulator
VSKSLARAKRSNALRRGFPGKRRAIGRPGAGNPGVGRDLLIARTCELLRELPPSRVTRAQVARYTGVDPTLIRYYFKDRSSLLMAVAEEVTSQFPGILAEALRKSEQSPQGHLRARIGALLDLNVTYPFFHRLIVEEVMTSKAAAARALLGKLTERGVGAYTAILAAGAKDGSLRSVDSALLFLSIIGVCEFFVAGLPILRIAAADKHDEAAMTARYKSFICDLLLNGLKSSRHLGRTVRS